MTDFKTSRSIYDLLDSLKRHLHLLSKYSDEAFENNNEDYFGEVAGKIRLLAIQYHSNKPLLVGLMKEFNVNPKQIFDGPPIQYPEGHKHLKPGDKYTLETYLLLDSMGYRTKDDGFKMLNNSEFVSLLAEKYGAAHEDWNHPEILQLIRNTNLYIGGKKPHILQLRNIANWVIWAGNEFISKLDEEVIEEINNKRNIAIDYNDYLSHGKLGTYYLNKRNFKKALKHLRKSCELNDEIVETHWNLACLFSLESKYDKSLQHLKLIKDKWGVDGLGNPYDDEDMKNLLNESFYKIQVDLLLEKNDGSL